MFSVQNGNLRLNLPQLSTVVKGGMFQCSSFNSVKKVPDLDTIRSEFARTAYLLRELKSEKILNAFADFKCDINFKGSNWFCLENIAFKFTAGRRKNFSNIHIKYKEPVSCTPSFSRVNKINAIFQHDKCEKQSFQNLSEQKRGFHTQRYLKSESEKKILFTTMLNKEWFRVKEAQNLQETKTSSLAKQEEVKKDKEQIDEQPALKKKALLKKFYSFFIGLITVLNVTLFSLILS